MNAQYPHLLIFKEGPSAGKTYPLEGEEILIGREPDCTLQIDSPGISRRHARIIFQNNQFLLEDLGSSNGTFVNGERISGPQVLRNGDLISLGKLVQLEYQVALPTVSMTMLEGEAPPLYRTMIEEAPEPPPAPTQLHQAPLEPVPPAAPPPAHAAPSVQHPEMTMIGQDLPGLKKDIPPQMIIAIAGQALKTFDLQKSGLTSVGQKIMRSWSIHPSSHATTPTWIVFKTDTCCP